MGNAIKNTRTRVDAQLHRYSRMHVAATRFHKRKPRGAEAAALQTVTLTQLNAKPAMLATLCRKNFFLFQNGPHLFINS